VSTVTHKKRLRPGGSAALYGGGGTPQGFFFRAAGPGCPTSIGAKKRLGQQSRGELAGRMQGARIARVTTTTPSGGHRGLLRGGGREESALGLESLEGTGPSQCGGVLSDTGDSRTLVLLVRIQRSPYG